MQQMRQLLLSGTFASGHATAEGAAVEAKHNVQLADDSDMRKQLDQIVMQAIMNNQTFVEHAFPKAVLRPTFNRYDVGMDYGAHVDAAFMNQGRMRADLSITVFLSEPADYDGGELVIMDGAAEHSIKYPAGDAVLYPTMSLHRVTPVARGSRLAANTRIESCVPDPHRREILSQFAEAKYYFEAQAPDVPAAHALRVALFNLTRMWWQT